MTPWNPQYSLNMESRLLYNLVQKRESEINALNEELKDAKKSRIYNVMLLLRRIAKKTGLLALLRVIFKKGESRN